VAESYAPGVSATAVAVRHGLHRNQIFAWRRQFRHRTALLDHTVPEFVPVALASQIGCGSAKGDEAGRIELIGAGITIRIGTGFGAGDLCESAWNKAPVLGVIGIQSGPLRRRVHDGFHGGHGGPGRASRLLVCQHFQVSGVVALAQMLRESEEPLAIDIAHMVCHPRGSFETG
jgi:transposase